MSQITTLKVNGESNTHVNGPLNLGDEVTFPEGYVRITWDYDAEWHRESHPATTGKVVVAGFDYVGCPDGQYPWYAPGAVVAVRCWERGPVRLYGAYVFHDEAFDDNTLHFVELSQLGETGGVRLPE